MGNVNSKMRRAKFIALRRRTGLSQRAFGEKLGFSAPQPRVSEIERGKSPISMAVEAACKLIEAELEAKEREALERPGLTK